MGTTAKMCQLSIKEVNRMEAEDIIERSASDWCSALVIAKKPDGIHRFCIDYRDLKKGPLKMLTRSLGLINSKWHFQYGTYFKFRLIKTSF